MRGFEVLEQGISQRHSDYYFINSEGIGPMGGRGAAFSAISSFVYRPNSPSRCCSNHFSHDLWKASVRAVIPSPLEYISVGFPQSSFPRKRESTRLLSRVLSGPPLKAGVTAPWFASLFSWTRYEGELLSSPREEGAPYNEAHHCGIRREKASAESKERKESWGRNVAGS
jgi:hypothetical protein